MRLDKAQDNRKAVFRWVLYDWANSAFFVVVISGFFPLFFKQFWASELSGNESTFWLGMTSGISGLLVALAAPVLGAIADRGGYKHLFLRGFTLLGVVATALLFFVEMGSWQTALLLFGMASLGVSGAIVFYDAMLVDVTGPDQYNRVSSLGYAWGYIGGGLLFAVNVLMTLKPAWFGLHDAGEAVRWAFVMVAIWWGVFAWPLLAEKRRSHRRALDLLGAVGSGWQQLIDTFRHIRGFRVVFLFLAAYFFYIDGVGTVIRMAVDYGLALGFESSALIIALLITQFVAFPCALLWGSLGDRWGAKRSILICIAGYVVACLMGYGMQSPTDFYLLATLVGMVMGGIQALSRSLYARLIPQAQSAEFFGFFNMLGKFAAVMGPVLMGATSLMTGSARFSILVIVLLFAVGAMLLYRVKVDKYSVVKGG